VRVPVLPRKVAAGATVSALSIAGWAIAAATLLLTIPGLTNVFIRHGYASDLWMPLSAVVLMLAALALAAFRTSPLTLALYIAVGGISVYVYLLSLMGHHTELLVETNGPFIFNRLALALVIVGTSSSKPLSAVFWGIAGYLTAEGVTVLTSIQLGQPVQLGFGPSLALANYCAAYLGLSLIQRSQRGRVPDFIRLRQQTRMLEAERSIQQRAAAILHDTVLNDLALVVNGPAKLDDRMRDRMRQDIATLSRADLLMDRVSEHYVDQGDVQLRNQLTALVSDFQWRGLSVDITGDRGGVAHIDPEVVEAAAGALRASLENVLKHSGTDAAEVIVSTTHDSLTWTVSDAGVGFDPKAVGQDRLGLRASIIQRVESVGGVVRVWSSPGNGASILITVPMRLPADPVNPADPSDAAGPDA
jgi:signal transduction histidine kinase